MRWWRDYASVVGTAAQWFAGIASIGTMLVAFYGLSKAVPYFENLNLRETNAQLQIGNRKLVEERERLDKQVAEASTRLMGQETKTEYALGLYLCSSISGITHDVIDRARDKSFRHYLLADMKIADPTPVPEHMQGPRVTLRKVMDVPAEVTKDNWWRASEGKALAAWKEMTRRHESKLDTVLFPGADGKVRPPAKELDAALDNVATAWALRREIEDTCESLLPGIPK